MTRGAACNCWLCRRLPGCTLKQQQEEQQRAGSRGALYEHPRLITASIFRLGWAPAAVVLLTYGLPGWELVSQHCALGGCFACCARYGRQATTGGHAPCSRVCPHSSSPSLLARPFRSAFELLSPAGPSRTAPCFMDWMDCWSAEFGAHGAVCAAAAASPGWSALPRRLPASCLARHTDCQWCMWLCKQTSTVAGFITQLVVCNCTRKRCKCWQELLSTAITRQARSGSRTVFAFY